MVIPTSCKDIVIRNRINECCEPDLEGKPLKQQVYYLTGCCSYLTSVIIALIHLVRALEQENQPGTFWKPWSVAEGPPEGAADHFDRFSDTRDTIAVGRQG